MTVVNVKLMGLYKNLSQWSCAEIRQKKTFVEPKRVSANNNLGTSLGHLRTVPTFVTAHTFCAS